MVVDGNSYRVIGVMRSDFDWPRSRDLWVPLGLAPDATAAGNRFNENYDSAVRMKPGVSVAQLNAALGQKRLEEIRREGSKGYAEKSGWGMFAQPWTQGAAGELREPPSARGAGAVPAVARSAGEGSWVPRRRGARGWAAQC